MKTLSLASFFTLLISSPLFAQEGVAPPEPGMWQPIIMIGIAMMFFYFILWRPEQKRRKALEEQRAALKTGDRVTAMGIIGHVVRETGETVILKMYDGAKIEVLKGAITDVDPGVETESKND
jgi:preprotein translocase subunit YajC